MASRRCPKQNFSGGEPLRKKQRDAACASLVVSATGGIQGCVVAVGGHQVQAVDVVRDTADVDVAQDGARGGQSGRDKVLLLGKVETRSGKKGEEVGALEGIRRVLPHDCA